MRSVPVQAIQHVIRWHGAQVQGGAGQPRRVVLRLETGLMKIELLRLRVDLLATSDHAAQWWWRCRMPGLTARVTVDGVEALRTFPVVLEFIPCLLVAKTELAVELDLPLPSIFARPMLVQAAVAGWNLHPTNPDQGQDR